MVYNIAIFELQHGDILILDYSLIESGYIFTCAESSYPDLFIYPESGKP
jgi:hypothetical protein